MNKELQHVFSQVYVDQCWGATLDSSHPFCSGAGSHDPSVAIPYLESVSGFLEKLPIRPRIVDLGCGDFAIGSRLAHYGSSYTACDIVPELIKSNRLKFHGMGVDFRVLDITTEDLPRGDIAIVRQVLQHLSNSDIQAVLPKLIDNYTSLIVTEHLPLRPGFYPNIEKPSGSGIRMGIGSLGGVLSSGVVLTEAPFNLRVKSQRTLCVAYLASGRIQTMLYDL